MCQWKINMKLMQGGVFSLHTFINGFAIMLLGPILPDLQCLLEVDLKTASYLFLTFSIGNILSMAVSGFTVKRCNPHLLLLTLLLVQSIGIALLPFSGTIYMAAGNILLLGFTPGLSLCVILHQINIVWPSSKRTTHIIFALSSLGSVSCPLILTPFLSDGAVTRKYRSKINGDHSTILNLDANSTYLGFNNSNNTNVHCSEGFMSLIQYPFLMFGLVGIPGIVIYLIVYVKSKNDNALNEFQAIPDVTQNQPPGKMFLFLMFLFSFQGQGYPAGFSGLLTTYGMNSQKLSSGVTSSMTALYWLAFTVGRVLPAFLPDSFDQTYVVLSTLFGNFVGVILLAVSVFGNTALLWTCCVFLGLFTGPCLAVGLTWTGQVITLTPNIKAFYLTTSCCGLLFPYVCGTLMNSFGDNCFVYFFSGFYIYTVCVYICVNINIRFQRKKVGEGEELK